MAVMDGEERRRVWAHLMRSIPAEIAPMPAVTKAELRAAVDACDEWITLNAAVFNAALPQPFRAEASAAQKTWLFAMVALRRAGLLRARED